MKKYFLIAASLIFLASCQTQKEEPAEEGTTVVAEENAEQNIEENANTPYSPAEDAEWQEFFKEFQAAVKAGDKEKLQSMVHIENLNADFVEDNFYVFSDDARDEILKMSADDATVTEDYHFGEYVTLTDPVLEMYYSFEDEEMDQSTGIDYYFSKINGVYKLVAILAFG